ncbi:hypothetical protein P885DRAFT_74117 [Corynascus similis CBS 632.67]
MRFSHHPFRLASYCVASLLALSALTHAASGTAEIDLVFPQNDTYTPSPIFPVAFALQSSELVGYLQPRLGFSIFPYGNFTENVADGFYYMTWANFSSADPYMQYGDALESLNAEGIWTLRWQLSIAHCAASGDLNVTWNYLHGEVIFTTKKGAKKPDLAAATQRESCANDQGFAIGITKTRDSGDSFENGKPCAVLAETTLTPTPCAVTVDAPAASSISSSLTSRACRIQATPTPWCPAPEEDAALGLATSNLAVGSAVCLAAAVGGLGFLAMV